MCAATLKAISSWIITKWIRETKNFFWSSLKFKLEFGKKSFKFQGAKIYNDLPLSVRNSNTNFEALLDEYFNWF